MINFRTSPLSPLGLSRRCPFRLFSYLSRLYSRSCRPLCSRDLSTVLSFLFFFFFLLFLLCILWKRAALSLSLSISPQQVLLCIRANSESSKRAARGWGYYLRTDKTVCREFESPIIARVARSVTHRPSCSYIFREREEGGKKRRLISLVFLLPTLSFVSFRNGGLFCSFLFSFDRMQKVRKISFYSSPLFK